MRCGKCGSFNVYCKDSRWRDEGYRYRRYVCESCGRTFTTKEIPWNFRKQKEEEDDDEQAAE